jgi:hypothetical protein
VSVSIDEFMADRAGQSHLVGVWWPEGDDDDTLPHQRHPFDLTEPLPSFEPEIMAQSMSLLLARLADLIDAP